MTEYTLNEIKGLSEETGTKIVEYEGLIYLVDMPEGSLPLSDKMKLRIYSNFVRSEFYRSNENVDADEYDETMISNLLYVWWNEDDGIIEYDVISKDFQVLDTNWFHFNGGGV